MANFFDKFKGKKKQKTEEFLLPEDITLWDLKKGYMLDYDFKTWEVKGVYEYDWGRTGKSTEYKIFDGTEYLSMGVDEQEGELLISMSYKIKISDLQGKMNTASSGGSGLGFQTKSSALTTTGGGQAIRNSILQHGTPPKEISYEGTTYYMDEESEGFFRDLDERERFRFIEWHYEDPTEEKFITISRWSETELEVYAGVYAQDFEVSNILPR